MDAAIYTRISQDKTGEAAGVTRQLEDCRALADRLGWHVVKHYDDNDVSAYSGKRRPGFEDMFAGMAANEFGAIICWHPDRLYRSLKDLERLIDVADERGVQIRTANGGDLDLSNATGKMLARILGSVARQESEHKGERRRRANQQLREAGQWMATGFRRFGYTQSGEPMPDEAEALRAAAADVLAGKSIRSIAADWAARGIVTTQGNPWTPVRLQRTLKRPVYAGLVAHRGEIVGQGTWQPVLDEDTHRGVVAVLADPARRKGNGTFDTRHMGSGVYRCGRCGEPLGVAYPNRRKDDRGPLYYVCRTDNVHLGRVAAPIDEYIETLVLGILSGSPVAGRLADTSGKRATVDDLHTQRAALRAQLDQLTDMFTAGTIDGSALQRGAKTLRRKMTDVDARLAELARRSPVVDLLANTDRLAQRWDGLTPAMRGRVIDELMTVTVLPVGKGTRRMDVNDPESVDKHLRIEPKA